MSTTEEYIRIIEAGAPLNTEEIIQLEISNFKASDEFKEMRVGEKYYRGDHDILERKRMSIGEGGNMIEDPKLANRKLLHAFSRKLTDQKTNYLLSKQPSVQTKNAIYAKLLSDALLDKNFLRRLKNVGKDAITNGRAWMFVYYNEEGLLSFKRIPPKEIIPIWKDNEHTELEAVIRFYEVDYYEGRNKLRITKVEYWTTSGVQRYVMGLPGRAAFIPDPDNYSTSHFSVLIDGDEEPAELNWARIPFICFKYNSDELPLIKFLKALIDDYDLQRSDSSNNIADLPNSAFKIKNYGGSDLGQFRHNLNYFKAVLIEGDGDVDTLSMELNPEAIQKHTDQLRKDIYEFGRGVDTQSEKFGNSPSGIALKFLYADLDLDANEMETEFQAAIDNLLWFIDTDAFNRSGGKEDYAGEAVDFIFNRDILINETEAVTNSKDSVGVISEETIIANHPWVTDARAEMKRINKERKEAEQQTPTYPGLEEPPQETGGDEE